MKIRETLEEFLTAMASITLFLLLFIVYEVIKALGGP